MQITMGGNDRLFIGKDDAAIGRAPLVLSVDTIERAEQVLIRAAREISAVKVL